MTPVERIADAFRTLSLRLDREIEGGRQNWMITAEELSAAFLSIADDLDPPVLNTVEPEFACPSCGERDAETLEWQDQQTIRCSACGTTYQPSM